jgi:hypothetical protein
MSLSIIKTTCGCVDMYQGFPPRGSLSVTVLLPSFIRMVSTPWVCDQLAMDLPHSSLEYFYSGSMVGPGEPIPKYGYGYLVHCVSLEGDPPA